MLIAAAALIFTSATFPPGGTMPMATVYTQCGGTNRSPELHWAGAPRRTRSFALIVHDPDAPHPGGWYHWVAYNIPASAAGVAYGAGHIGTDGPNDFGNDEYDGPCPPPGRPHHYHFTLYALDIPKIAGDRLNALQLKAAMEHHVLATVTLTGMYGR